MASRQKLSRYGSIVMVVAAGILLFFAQSAYWVNHTVFSQDNFSRITSTALLSDSSRDAISNSIVDKSLEQRPLIKRAIGDRLVSLTNGLLGSDLAAQAVHNLSTKTYAYATSKDRQDIGIDLTTVKKPLAGIIALSQNDGGKLSSFENQIPDEIVLVRSDAFPDLSGVVKLMLWLGPFLWLSTIVLFGLYIYIGRNNYAKRVYLAGLSIVTVAIFGLLTSPFIPPPIAAAIPTIGLRPVVENITVGFLAPFRSQMYYMLSCVLVVLLIFNQRFNILAAIQSLAARLSSRLNKTPVKQK